MGFFCYRVFPFALKNACATNQQVITRIFDEHIHHQVEHDVVDIIVNSVKGIPSIKFKGFIL